MAKITNLGEKNPTIKEKISFLLQKNRVTFLIILGAAVAILVAMAIVLTIRDRRLNQGILKMEALIETYENEWIAAEGNDDEDDEEKQRRAALEEKINDEIDFLLSEYRDSFPGQKALFIRGDLAYRQEKWTEAASTFSSIAAEYPASYLAPVALMYAAASAEEGEDLEGALENLQRVVTEYPENLEETYRAMFNIGRIQELQGNSEEALASYNRLLDTGASNAWASLAQSRVVLLENQ